MQLLLTQENAQSVGILRVGMIWKVWRAIQMQVNGMRQQNGRRRAAALWLAGVMALSLAGCGGPAGDGKGGTSGTGKPAEDSVAMGRYVETMMDVDTGEILDLKELTDGKLVLLENGAEGRWTSEDGGATWQPDMVPEWNEFVTDYYIFDMKASSDGSMAILCKNYGVMMTEDETGDEEGEEPEAEEESSESDEEAAETEEPEVKGNGVCVCIVPPQGSGKWVDVPTGEFDVAKCLSFSEDGSRLFVATMEQKIYEIDMEAGRAKLFLTADFTPDVICVWENYMALKNEQEGVALYHLDTGEQIEDDVITDFVKENCTMNQLVAQSTYSIFPAEEAGIYLVCGKGVYRHVIGGTVMEQVINGGLTSFSDPTKHVAKMIRTAEEGFLAAFSEGKISSFVYDPNISTVPLQTLTAYSLTENDILRQAIIRYQGNHPDVYVEYKIGMDEESGATREDAVKKLNTEIMAGKGPDFLLLDGLPANSYVEKGVLADLTPYLAKIEENEKLLANIKESFTEDGKIRMIPAAVTLSLYMTDKENMTEVSDLSTLADMIEKLRSEHPGEGIMETYSEEMLLDALMPVSAPLWFTEKGQFNEAEMSNYLEQTKRIYSACMEGLPEDILRKYLERSQKWVYSSHEFSAYNDLLGGATQIVAGHEKVTLGELKNAYNYAFVQSVKQPQNGENGTNCQLAPLPGSVKDAYKPMALMGINAASSQTEQAAGLLQEVLSEKTQSLIYPTGFPINEAGLQTYLDSLGGMLTGNEANPGEPFSGYALSEDDGTMISLGIYVPTKQETKELYDMLSSVSTPYLSDAVVEDVVREVGKWYLEDKCSLEEAVQLVQEKIAIYMSE